MKKIIGLGGVARCGKDTFAAILENKLQQAGRSVKKIALAGPLKQHCDKFLTENIGISAFTQIPQEKLIIRPFLVWYGDAQRKRTNGKFWTNIASNEIKNSNYDYYIVTDIRYDDYPIDELQWLKNEWKGILCHVSKYFLDTDNQQHLDFDDILFHKKFVMPANEHEEKNDPKIKKAADYIVEWPHVCGKDSVTNLSDLELLMHPTLNEHVDKFMSNYGID